MLARTHFAFGILAGVLALPMFDFSSIFQYAVYFLIIHLAVLLPDCDHPESSINKKVKVTKLVTFFFSHRGLLHSIFPPLIFSALLYYYANYFIAAAFFIGYFSHLLSDALTVNGIRFLHPLFSFKISANSSPTSPKKPLNKLPLCFVYFKTYSLIFMILNA